MKQGTNNCEYMLGPFKLGCEKVVIHLGEWKLNLCSLVLMDRGIRYHLYFEQH